MSCTCIGGHPFEHAEHARKTPPSLVHLRCSGGIAAAGIGRWLVRGDVRGMDESRAWANEEYLNNSVIFICRAL